MVLFDIHLLYKTLSFHSFKHQLLVKNIQLNTFLLWTIIFYVVKYFRLKMMDPWAKSDTERHLKTTFGSLRAFELTIYLVRKEAWDLLYLGFGSLLAKESTNILVLFLWLSLNVDTIEWERRIKMTSQSFNFLPPVSF